MMVIALALRTIFLLLDMLFIKSLPEGNALQKGDLSSYDRGNTLDLSGLRERDTVPLWQGGNSIYYPSV